MRRIRYAVLANFAVNRTVINETGLAGAFDIELRFAPEGIALVAATRGDDAPSIFTAVQEQLDSDFNPIEVPSPLW